MTIGFTDCLSLLQYKLTREVYNPESVPKNSAGSKGYTSCYPS